jgi:hypothetical protein
MKVVSEKFAGTSDPYGFPYLEGGGGWRGHEGWASVPSDIAGQQMSMVCFPQGNPFI